MNNPDNGIINYQLVQRLLSGETSAFEGCQTEYGLEVGHLAVLLVLNLPGCKLPVDGVKGNEMSIISGAKRPEKPITDFDSTALLNALVIVMRDNAQAGLIYDEAKRVGDVFVDPSYPIVVKTRYEYKSRFLGDMITYGPTIYEADNPLHVLLTINDRYPGTMIVSRFLKPNK